MIFTAQVVRRTLLGTDGFSGFAAPAAINGGHQEDLTSPSFCKAESILISCVQIKIKPVEMYHSLSVLGKQNYHAMIHCSMALGAPDTLIVFGENYYVYVVIPN
jgi:hypothetical protein